MAATVTGSSGNMAEATAPPLIAHVVHRFDIGGLENGVVNLINRLGSEYRHAVICLTDYNPQFCRRIHHPAVSYHALHKRPGQDWAMLWQLGRLLRQLRPAVLHTRNLATLEAQAIGWLARVPARLHGEHGWDMADLHGKNRRYRMLRRLFVPLIDRYIALSVEGERYLHDEIGVAAGKIERIINGVDAEQFQPLPQRRDTLLPAGFVPEQGVVIGSVGRLAEVKNHVALAHAFGQLLQQRPELRQRARLVIVGAGPQREAVQAILQKNGHAHALYLAGAQQNIAEWMQSFDLFVLPSLAEGISNTILEAMACGLPVVATAVGGNRELVEPGVTGQLVPLDEPESMVQAVLDYVEDAPLRARHGAAGRARIERELSLARMVERYRGLYRQLAFTDSTAAGLHARTDSTD